MAHRLIGYEISFNIKLNMYFLKDSNSNSMTLIIFFQFKSRTYFLDCCGIRINYKIKQSKVFEFVFLQDCFGYSKSVFPYQFQNQHVICILYIHSHIKQQKNRYWVFGILLTLKINMGIMDFSDNVNSSNPRNLNVLICIFFYFSQQYFIQYIIYSISYNVLYTIVYNVDFLHVF